MSEQDRPYKPFDSAFKTLIAVCPQLLISVLNEIFGTTFSIHDKVVLMDSKQMKPLPMGKIATREVDGLFTIGCDLKMTYHVELQSTHDSTMVARFWEYDSHTAMMNAEITPDGVMRVRFPRSAVLYLRHNANTPEVLTVQAERADGTCIDLHEIPVIKTQMYTLDGVGVRALYAAIMSVLRGLAREHEDVMKGARLMLEGQILDDIAFRIHDKAWEEGEAKGRQEGILSTLFGLVRGGHLGADIASAQAGLSLKAFNAKMAEYEARPQA